jgi:nucleotide-binding universal stress UspA family protein
VSRSDGPVLLAYDGSPGSATAIAVAGRLLAPRLALVCHVWSGVSMAVFHGQPSELPGALRDSAEELDQADLAAAERTGAEGVRLARAAGFQAEPLLARRERKTWRTLLEAVEQSEASLIVAGAHGMSGIARALLGSVSTGLVHHARVPVLVVPGTATGAQADGPLLLCYDGSEPSKQAIAAAGSLLRPRSALVLHVWESWVAHAPALAGVSSVVRGTAAELDEIADEQSEERATEGVELAQRHGFEVAGLSERAGGPAWRAVLESADEHSCAAIVLGSRGLTGLSAALGSVSSAVLHQSRRPVLVVPPGE